MGLSRATAERRRLIFGRKAEQDVRIQGCARLRLLSSGRSTAVPSGPLSSARYSVPNSTSVRPPTHARASGPSVSRTWLFPLPWTWRSARDRVFVEKSCSIPHFGGAHTIRNAPKAVFSSSGHFWDWSSPLRRGDVLPSSELVAHAKFPIMSRTTLPLRCLLTGPRARSCDAAWQLASRRPSRLRCIHSQADLAWLLEIKNPIAS